MKIYIISLLFIFLSITGSSQKVTLVKTTTIGLFDNKQEFQGFLTGIENDIDLLFRNFLLVNSNKSPFGNYDSSKISVLKPLISIKENEASLKLETAFIVVDFLKKAILDDCNAVLSNVVNLNFSTNGMKISVIQDVSNEVSYSLICLGSKKRKQTLESRLPTNRDLNNFMDNLNKLMNTALERKISAITSLRDYSSQYLTFSDLVLSIESVKINKENIFVTLAYSFTVN